jgi:hypothetical protein
MKNVKKYTPAAEAAMILLNLADRGRFEDGKGKLHDATWIGIWSDGDKVAAVALIQNARRPLVGLGYDKELRQVFVGTKMFGRPIEIADEVLAAVQSYNQKSREIGSGGFILKVVDYTTDGTVHELSI